MAGVKIYSICITGTMKGLRLLILLCSFVLTQQLGWTNISTANRIPFRYVQSFIIVEVKLAQVMPLRLIFDTGAEHNVIFNKNTTDIFTDVYLRKIKVFGSDLQEEIPALLTQSMDLSFGEAGTKSTQFIVLEKNFTHIDQIIGEPVHGIISASMFKDFRIEINYKKSIIYLHPLPKEKKLVKGFYVYPMHVIKNKPYVNSSITFNKNSTANLNLLLDTGAGLPLLLYSNTDSSIVLPEKVIPGLLGSGLGGMINGTVGQIQNFTLGDFQISNIYTYFQQINTQELQQESETKQGIIGNQILDRFRVILDYNHEQLFLKPNRQYDKAFAYDKSGMNVIAGGSKLNEYYISFVIFGSPSSNAGLMSGDRILSVNRIPVSFLTIGRISRKFQGDEGEVIRLKINRNGRTFIRKIHLKNLFSEN